MKMPKLFAAFLMLFGAFVFTNCGGGASNAIGDFNVEYEKYELENGLDVILHKDDSDPIVSVAIMFHVGSNREKPGRTGFAHFFEHMLFQASENVGKGKFFKTINELGGTFNGGTWNDGTVYYEVIPKDALEKVLWMESDRMGFMINTVTTPVLENEKQVVKNEKRQRVDNQPYGHTSYVIDKTLYPEDHPYNWQVIGSLEDLQNATIDDVKEFYNKWYGANNATMVIAGDIDMEGIKPLIEKYFAEIPAREEVAKLEPRPAVLKETIKLVHEDNFANLPEMRMVFPTVQDGHPDSYALDYLGQLLSQGKRAPMYKEVVEAQKLAPSTSSYNSAREIAGNFYVRVRGNNGADLNKVHDAVMTSFKNFEANGIDDRDMERIKNASESSFYGGISSILNKSFQLAQMNEFRGSPDAIKDEVKNILGVSKEDVIRVYNEYIKDKPYVLTSFVPKGKAELAVKGSAIADIVEELIVEGAETEPLEEKEGDYVKTPSKIDRTIIPALGEAPVVQTPSIFTKELSNGMEVYGIQNNELPLVNFSMRIKGGMLFEDPAKIGVTNLMTDVMMEGTKNKTPEELEDAIGQLGSNINMYAGSEYITLSGNCLARNFDKTMALVEEVLTEPRWDTKEFERLKKKLQTTIQQRSVQPNYVAGTVFNKLIYGKENILSNAAMGTAETVENITLDDLKNYYSQYMSPNLTSYHVVGGVTEAQTSKALAGISDKWENKDLKMPVVEAPAAVAQPQVYFVDIPNSKQSIVRIGSPAMKGNADDYYAASFVNEDLGGGSNGRLFQQLREEKGYTYGAYSGFARKINDGTFSASSSVRSNVTLESVELFEDILKGYQNEFDQATLDKTKNMLLKQNALAFETFGNKLNILQNISTYDLPLDYIKKEQAFIEGMTLENAKETIGKYIDPSKMIYLVVGDGKTQFSRLKKAGLGKPVMIDKNAEPVKEILN